MPTHIYRQARHAGIAFLRSPKMGFSPYGRHITLINMKVGTVDPLPAPNFTFTGADMWEYSPQNCQNLEYCAQICPRGTTRFYNFLTKFSAFVCVCKCALKTRIAFNNFYKIRHKGCQATSANVKHIMYLGQWLWPDLACSVDHGDPTYICSLQWRDHRSCFQDRNKLVDSQHHRTLAHMLYTRQMTQ